MKRARHVCSVAASLLVLFLLLAGQVLAAAHLDKGNLPLGCATCHYRSNLKNGGGAQTCLVCHGQNPPAASVGRMPKGFAAPGMKLKDIESEFRKLYRHPTFDAPGIHRSGEILPETDARLARHADCVDCHHPHFVDKDKKFAGIRGKRIGNMVAEVTAEHELCYRCHGDSANLPGKYTNKKIEFALTNPSYHPVEGEGKNSAVVSLLHPYKEKKNLPTDVATISCGDCHGSDRADAPRGPHGSTIEHILVEQYSTRDNSPESTSAYALCYRCHRRESILGNESFRYHSLHIAGKGGVLSTGTSCYTCHSSHGSTMNKYLIRFNPLVVTPNSRGMLKYVEKGIAKFSGECYLTCHGVDHNPKSY